MSETNRSNPAGLAGRARFATTHWSVVLAAGSPERPGYRQAVETLCRSYWFPIYAYLRRQGCTPDQAEDHVQGFIAYLLEKQVVSRADPGCGRFRSFLLGTLKHFLSDERDRARAGKRGGGRKLISLDLQDAESGYAFEPAHDLSPEKLFERSWAVAVLERTMARLRAESADRDKQGLFDRLKVYLTTSDDQIAYRDKAAELGISEGAVRVAVHRLRRRYRELLRDEIAQTVADEDQIDEEIMHLFAALGP